MTLKTVTGPTIRAALADARRLFGDDAVLLQSTPPAPGAPASVTVGFDAPAPAADPAPARRYGYGAAPRPAAPAPAASAPVVSAPAPPPVASAPALLPLPPPVPPAPPAPAPEASATADELARLRARLSRLEAALADARVTIPAARPPVVLVGPAGSGKTSLVRRLGQAPAALDATSAGVIVVAPEDDAWLDPSPLYWTVGVPAVVVRSPDDVRAALDTLAGADLVLVDTPALPLDPARARAAVARLGAVLAPLAPVEVHFVVDAARDRAALSGADVAALGLAPDALALTRLDEAPPRAAADWAEHLGLPLRVASHGPDPGHVSVAEVSAARPAAPAPVPSDLPPALAAAR